MPSVQAPSTPAPSRSRLALRLGAATTSRLFLNTARRFPYPFAAVLGRGLGVPLTAVTSLIAATQATGLLSPLSGPLGDRLGYRVPMVAGLALLSVGTLGVGLWPGYGVALVGLLLAGLGKSMYDPAFQAYIGQTVSYRRRGLAIGLGELAWAGSSLIGIPAVGFLIAGLGWRAPFFALAALGVAGGLVLARLLPADAAPCRASHREEGRVWSSLFGHRPATGGLAFGFLASVANDCVFVVYGVWLETRFGLEIAALGVATTAIGLAELAGEGLTALLADRVGHKRALAAGILLSTLAYALLPLTGASLTTALAGLFLVFLFYEFSIVTSFSLMTEVLPGARGTMMSAYTAALGLGRMAGALLGGAAWLAGGMPATALLSASASGLALLALLRGTRGWAPRSH